MVERKEETGRVLQGLGISAVAASFVSGMFSYLVDLGGAPDESLLYLVFFGVPLFAVGFVLLVVGAHMRPNGPIVEGAPADAVPERPDPMQWLTRCALAAKDGSGNRCYLEIAHKGLHKYGTLDDVVNATEVAA